jgi:histone acetyltransferase (RNA polymerase elongator complex component)
MKKAHAVVDIEELGKKYDIVIRRKYEFCTEDMATEHKALALEVANYARAGGTNRKGEVKRIMRRHGFDGKHSMVFQVSSKLLEMGDKDADTFETALPALRELLKIKRTKSHSGVLVITIFTSPHPEFVGDDGVMVRQDFSCHWNCAYCPSQPGQPRSYLQGEPGVLRANKNEFDCVRQMWDRMRALYMIGHVIDKLEVIVLGGTWASYPVQYREQFIRDMYYAANTFGEFVERERGTLHEEKLANQSAGARVIGLTLETRPDCIDMDELKRFRSYGCTRVQLGIQHLDDGVLHVINRKCTTAQTVHAIRLLKDACFKIDGHFMPNLPGSTPEKDRDMMINKLLGMRTPLVKRWQTQCMKATAVDAGAGVGRVEWEEWLLSHPEFQLDQWKVYPCAVTPWTDIAKWHEAGTYVPYGEAELVDLLMDTKTLVFPWVRLNRVVRDIPTDYIIDSSDRPNLRQELAVMMEKEGKRCACIRCREVKEQRWDGSYVTRVRRYPASNGLEYFVAAESEDGHTLYGFLRLRITRNPFICAFPELKDSGMIRELHVYGRLQHVTIDTQSKTQAGAAGHVQHRGIGKHLVGIAERIASTDHGMSKMAVIAGEGTKPYYARLGYAEDGGPGSFMVKELGK